jgi:hypothetical protein
LEYQIKYPRTGGNKRKGVLDKDTMRDAIDNSVERGHVIKIVPEGDEVTPPPHKCYCMQQDQEQDFFIEAFTQLTTIEVWYLEIIPKQKCCLRSRQSANLVILQKKG